VELHRSWYEPPASNESYGRYVIAERSRCDSDFPLGYLDGGDYWRNCGRKRDVGFNDPNGTPLIGFDFARWSCLSATRGCETPPPPTTPSGDATVAPHGLCEVALPPTDDVWRGMSHHSQFKCVVVGDPANATEQLSRRPLTALYDGVDDSKRDQFNACHVACPAGDLSCTTDCSGSSCTTSAAAPSGGSGNPWQPKVACQAVSGTSIHTGDVGFVALRQVTVAAGDPVPAYQRGCINEWQESLYKMLCPGYLDNPGGIAGSSNYADFGAIVCGCGESFGGSECEIGCPAGDVFKAPLYTAVDRVGFWACGRLGASTATPLQQDVGDGNIGFRVRGSLPARIVPTTPLCEVSQTCVHGYTVR